MEGFYGEVRLFAGNFAPTNWAFCDGAVLQVSSNTALFVLLGDTFGGDGKTTFALPDLRGRVVVAVGQGSGLSNYALGKPAGTSQIPTQILHASGVSGPQTTVNPVRTGSGNNAQPVLGLNYIICVRGTFPDRPQ